MTKAETIFQKELSLIRDPEIKQFVITCFDKLCPDYFWTCPCSTTGKYHPQVSLGEGGLVRHTKLAVWWGIELLRALGTSSDFRNVPYDKLFDETVATLLLHDMIKNGKGLNAQGYPLDRGVTGTHGMTLASKINTHPDCDISDSKSYWRIIEGIRSHMGIWTTDSNYRPNTILNPIDRAFANLIHLADYCASRKVDEIYSILGDEKNDITQETTSETKVNQSSPCPGIRPTKGR